MKSLQTTTSVKAAERLCPRCGTKLGGFGPEGLCGVCLLGSGLTDAEPEQVPMQRMGDYELLGEIARGGMGVVYRARQAGLNRIVAVKVLLGGDFAGRMAEARFRQEAEAAAQLRHPNLVAIHEVGEHEGRPFFSMDFIEGQTLRQLTRDNPLPAARAAELLKTIAEAVHYAHERGVVHRDLKPANVLVDAAGQPHVTDFGLAKRIDAEADLTRSSDAMGTPGYMPPEQASGQSKEVGLLADVYALGAILYDLLTGRPPFRAATPLETLKQVVNMEPVAPRLLNPGIPRDLETICLKCLEKEPARRYASALDLVGDIERFLKDQPILASRHNALYRARKFVRRHRLGVAIAACFLLVLTAASVVSTVFALRADHERGKAVKALRDSEEARQRAEAVSKFMVDALRRPDPAIDGHELKVVDLLEQAATDLQEKFTGDPRIKADLLEAIGDTFTGLEIETNAAPLFAEALRLRKAELGPDHRTTLRLMHSLAHAQEYTNAIALYEETLERQRKALGSDDPDTLKTMCGLAHAYWGSIRHQDKTTASTQILARATELFEEAVRRGRTALAPGDPTLLYCVSALGQHYLSLERPTHALPLLEEAVRLQQEQLTPDHPHLLGSMKLLGDAHFRSGHHEKAVALYESALAGCYRKLGPGHQRTWETTYSAAVAYYELQRWNDVVRVLEDIVALRRLHKVPDPTAALFMRYLSLAYAKLRRDADALRMAQEEVELRKSFSGEDASETLTAMGNLSFYKARMGQENDALHLREKSFELSKAKYGLTAPTTLEAMRLVGLSHIKAGRMDDAHRLFQDLLKLHASNDRTDQPPPLDEVTGTLNSMASMLSKSNKTTEAELLLQDLLSVQRKRKDAAGEEGLDTRRLLGYWAQKAGRLDEALELFEDMARQATNRAELSPLRVQLMGLAANSLAETLVLTNQWAKPRQLLADLLVVQLRAKTNATEETANTRLLLGKCLLHEGQFSEAETHLLEAHSILARIRRGRSNTYATQSLLGEALAGQKKIGEAETALLSAQAGLLEIATKDPSFSRARLLTEATERVVRFYEASGKPEQIDSWKTNLLAVKRIEEQASLYDGTEQVAIAAIERRTNTTTIDLMAFYNSPLDKDWLSIAESGPAISNLLSADRVFNGMQYDVRGILQLSSALLREPGRPGFPAETNGIPVAQVASRLHFLLATAWNVADGTPIGSFVVHFVDGKSETIPLLYGDQVRDWHVRGDRETKLKTGRLAAARRIGDHGVCRIFTFEWKNPHPAISIRSLDFKSTISDCAPFLLGITAE